MIQLVWAGIMALNVVEEDLLDEEFFATLEVEQAMVEEAAADEAAEETEGSDQTDEETTEETVAAEPTWCWAPSSPTAA